MVNWLCGQKKNSTCILKNSNCCCCTNVCLMQFKWTFSSCLEPFRTFVFIVYYHRHRGIKKKKYICAKKKIDPDAYTNPAGQIYKSLFLLLLLLNFVCWKVKEKKKNRFSEDRNKLWWSLIHDHIDVLMLCVCVCDKVKSSQVIVRSGNAYHQTLDWFWCPDIFNRNENSISWIFISMMTD